MATGRGTVEARLLAAAAVGLAFCSQSPAVGQTIGQLTDPEQPAEEESVDILAAWIEQDGGILTFVIETRGDIPTTLPDPEDYVTFLWLVDADNNAATGQNHGALGSEFNVRAVVSEMYGGGWVDVTGSMPGGGEGAVAVLDNRIQITIGLSQIASPPTFHWRCNAFHVVDNICVSTNYETMVAVATPLPYVPPARVTITTPLLMLCPSGPNTGLVEVELRDAAGGLLDNSDYHLVFHSSNESVATVDEFGFVTAHSVPTEFWETPAVDVTADGVRADSDAIIRVTDTDLGVSHQTYPGSHVAFYLPTEIEGVDLDQITTDYQVVVGTDLAYEAQHKLTGVSPFGGGVHWFVLDVGNDSATLPCGLSGNPVRLGWEYGKPEHNSCYIVNVPGDRVPQWAVFFHEMGHNMTWPSWGFGQFCSSGSPHDWKYSEALASMAGAWSWYSLQRCSAVLAPTVREGMSRGFPNIDPGRRQALADYVAAGANYGEITVEAICDILWELYDDYGAKVWYGLFSTFVPPDQPLPCVVDNEARQATWVIAAASASAGEDLRARFATEYGFPVDDDAWSGMLAGAQARIDARPWEGFSPADFDCDDDVDLDDLTVFEACGTGPAAPYDPDDLPAACPLIADNNGVLPIDFDADRDIDQADFGRFQVCYSGEGNPGDPDCGE